jgi:beta-lactam-binding protein with PASTA domain
VPALAGQSQAGATARINAVGLRVGQIARRSDPNMASGAVLVVTPAPGTALPRGSAVNLVVSTGVAQVAVPPVVGRSSAVARNLLAQRNLAVGVVTTAPSTTVAKGLVVSSKPGSGAYVRPGAAVGLVVSSGPPVVTLAVPSVAGRSLANAQALLTGQNLAVGAVTNQASSTVAKGLVISSSPGAGAQVQSGTRVSLVVSSGPAATTVAVPDVSGRSLSSAQSSITGHGLAVGAVRTQPSSTVAKGVVIGSNPGAGAQVTTGSSVSLVVSSGPAATTVAVPDVSGRSLSSAQSSITGQGLAVGAVRTQPSSTAAKGVVISSNPGAGAQVASGSRVNLVVSSGPAVATVAVPDVAGSSLAEARALVASAKLVVGVVKQQASASVPAGQVIGSRPGAGAQVMAGTPVSLVVSSGGAARAAVPAVVGLTVAQATAKLQAAGLKVVAVDADGQPAKTGTVVSSNPDAGEPAPASGRVVLTVEPPT